MMSRAFGRFWVAAVLVAMPCGWGQATTPAAGVVPSTAGAPVASAAAQGGEDGFRSNPKFVDAIKDAKLLQRQNKMGFAADAFKKANKIAGGRCIECVKGMYDTSMKAGEWKDAIAAAQELEGIVTSPGSKATAEAYRGHALEAQGGEKPKPAQLEAAHAAYKAAIALDGKNANALFADGRVLAELGKMDDARADFQQCVSCVLPKDPARLRAEHFAENPELSLHRMAPPIAVTALDGSKFNLDAMGGRVVLVDFWATWCGPCNRELPHMKKIAKEFAGQPLVIISVSWDKDEEKWKDFVAKNEMTWVQYRDADHTLSDQFGINAIPHYFTIDSDGVLTSEMLGEDQDVEGKLKKLLKRARATQGAAAVASNGN